MPAALEPRVIRATDHRSRRACSACAGDEPTSFGKHAAADESSPRLRLAEATAPVSSSSPDERVELIVEYANSLGLRPQVNLDSGVISGVKILGLASRNGRRYRPDAMAAAAPLYEGVKVNVNHPKGGAAAPRDYQDRLGCLRNVRVCEGGLFG